MEESTSSGTVSHETVLSFWVHLDEIFELLKIGKINRKMKFSQGKLCASVEALLWFVEANFVKKCKSVRLQRMGTLPHHAQKDRHKKDPIINGS